MKSGRLTGTSLELAWNAILACPGAVLFYYFLHVRPVWHAYFIAEDSWVEWATFVAWGLGVFFFAWTLFKEKAARKPALFLLVLLTFLAAMEEISWGQRILGFSTTEWFAKRNLQGETTIHNLDVPVDLRRVTAIAVFLWTILLPLMTMKSERLRAWCHRLGLPIVPLRLWPFFLLAIYFSVSRWSPGKRELAEMYLSVGIAALSLDLALTARLGGRARGVLATLATATIIVSISALTALLVHLFPSPRHIKSRLNNMAIHLSSVNGMHRQAEMLFDYLDRNPQFLTAATRIHNGQLLMRTGRQPEAAKVFKLALSEQARLQREDPHDPAPYRNSGAILSFLGQPEEAKRAYLDARELDLARLHLVNDRAAKSSAHWSLAQTLLALGDHEAALREARMTRRLTLDHKTRREIDRLLLRTDFTRNTVP